MGNLKPQDYPKLRQIFDGDDLRNGGGMSTGGNHRSGHAERIANIAEKDPWAFNDDQVRQLLLKVFPRAFPKTGVRISQTQRKRASLWWTIIRLYFRMGYTAGRVATRLNVEGVREIKPLKPPKSGRWKHKHIEDTVHRIRKAAAGLRTTGKPRTRKGLT